MSDKPQSPGAESWLEKKLVTLEALYHKFGRDGLKDQPVADVGLLLSSKELRLRDAAKDRDLDDDCKAANRQLQLEVKDLAAYIQRRIAGLGLSEILSLGHSDRPRRQEPQKGRSFEREGR
jgi:hypothetical protein